VFAIALLSNFIAFRGADMDHINVLGFGPLFLWLRYRFVQMNWPSRRFQSITHNQFIRCLGVAVIATITGWSAGRVYLPPLVDPEAKENKFIKVSKVPTDDDNYKYGVLIEFGVTKLDSQGVAVAVKLDNWDTFDTWYGSPKKTHRQENYHLPAPWYLNPEDDPYTGNEDYFWTANPNWNITPLRSLYILFKSNVELSEPVDVMFFAVELNQRELSPKKEKLGQQYTKR